MTRQELFWGWGGDIDYKDPLQLDGAFSEAHKNYGKSPIFNNCVSSNFAFSSRNGNVSSMRKTNDVFESIRDSNGTEKGLNVTDKERLWKMYWLEYINAFNRLTVELPHSVVTSYIGRQAIELGIKYILLIKTSSFPQTHDLAALSEKLFAECRIVDDYMKDIDKFCGCYSYYIEGNNVEYFRYPEYKANSFFAGNRLDIEWLSYNFALILLKLIHFVGIDEEIN